MDHRENLLKIVQDKGPLLPSQINKELRTNVLFASAMLSEMVDQKKLRISSMKVGGSPLYYCDGQEKSLEGFAEKLGDADRKAFHLLKDKGVLRDRDLDPQVRVSLREIKDFAVPLEVNANGSSDLFWKYFLVGDGDAESLIKEYINRMAGDSAGGKGASEKEVQATISDVDRPAPEPPAPEEELVREVDAPLEGVEPQKPVTSVKMTPLEDGEVPEFAYQTSVSFSTEIDTDARVRLEKAQPPQEPEPAEPEFPEDDEFFQKIRHFFESSGIEIVEFENVRTGVEYDFVVKLPSNVGSLNYYCKARSKSKLNDGDVSTAFVHGQMKKLPILLLTVGELTRKAEELLDKEFRNMFVKRI